jgi:hypothetical protein
MTKTKHEEPAVRGVGAYLGGHPTEVPQRGVTTVETPPPDYRGILR